MAKVLKKDAIKAYKAFDKDFSCRGFKFEVGKQYKQEGKIAICQNGFHACLNLCDVYNYYHTDARLAEVLCYGEVLYGDDKIVAERIEIIREIEFRKFEGHNNTGDRNSGDYNSGYYNTGDRNSGRYNSGYYNTGDRNSGRYNTGDYNTGDRNTGDFNTGYSNSGDYNSGYRNSGDYNSGYRNSGRYNTGYRNTGDHNSGYSNSGDYNSGYRNSGDYNSGDYNSGDYNSGNCNSGFFNTETPPKIMFNKPVSSNHTISIPRYLFDIILISNGKEVSYKKAWENRSKLWTKKDIEQIRNMTNFNHGIFQAITGVNLDELEKDNG